MNSKRVTGREFLLSQPQWVTHPELVARLIKNSTDELGKGGIAEFVLSQPHWSAHPELVEQLIDKGTEGYWLIAHYVLSQSHWKNHPKFQSLVKRYELKSGRKMVGYSDCQNLLAR